MACILSYTDRYVESSQVFLNRHFINNKQIFFLLLHQFPLLLFFVLFMLIRREYRGKESARVVFPLFVIIERPPHFLNNL